jgi:hypothetical protein
VEWRNLLSLYSGRVNFKDFSASLEMTADDMDKIPICENHRDLRGVLSPMQLSI